MFTSAFRRLRAALAPVAVAAVALMAALALPGQSSAVGIAGCSVSPHAPFTFVYNGYRYARAYVYVTCTYGRSGIVTTKIMERDPGSFDDEVARRSELFTIQAGTTQRFAVTGLCRNFDLGSREELFTEGQLNIYGVNSAKAQSFEVAADC